MRVLVAFLAAGLGFPLLVAAASGSLAIPHNDGWAYSKVAHDFGLGHGFELVGWNRSFLLGQVVPLGPLGRWVTAQHLFVAGLGAAAVVATYGFLAPRVGRTGASIGAFLTLAFPGYALLSTSFMTDVPAYAAMVGCLSVGDAGLRRGRTTYVVLALVIGVWGATVREPAAAAPAALAAVAFWRWRGRRQRALIAASSMALIASFGLLEAWRHDLPNSGGWPPLRPADLDSVAADVRGAFFTLALPLLPALLASPPSWRSWRSWIVAVPVGAVGGWVVWVGRDLLLGNYFGVTNAYSAAGAGAEQFVPGGAWRLASAGAVVAGTLLVAAAIQRRRALDPLLATFTGLSLALLVVQSLRGQPLFDRYLLVLLPGALVVVLQPALRYRLLGAAAAAVLVAYSSLLALTTLAVDGARWQAAASLTRSGIAATDVDAGLEWIGWHTSRAVRQRNPPSQPGHSWYLPLFPEARDCFVVAAAPQPEGALLWTRTNRLLRLAGGRIWVYRLRACESEPDPSSA